MELIKDEDKLQASFSIETPSGKRNSLLFTCRNIIEVKLQRMLRIQAPACSKDEFNDKIHVFTVRSSTKMVPISMHL